LLFALDRTPGVVGAVEYAIGVKGLPIELALAAAIEFALDASAKEFFREAAAA
jgi:hypothetical protein